MPSATLILKSEPREDFELRGDSIRLHEVYSTVTLQNSATHWAASIFCSRLVHSADQACPPISYRYGSVYVVVRCILFAWKPKAGKNVTV
jgi:hypothetical protein